MVLVSPGSADSGEVAPDGTKKKKLTNHLEKSDGRRLVEYLVVVSSVERQSLSEEEKKSPGDDEQYRLGMEIDDDDIEIVDHEGFKPVVTARYPQYDHEDNPFDANVSYFCHISGAIQLKKNAFMPKVRVHRFYTTNFSTFLNMIHPILTQFFSSLLGVPNVDPLFRRNGRYREENIWNLFDFMGTD